MSRKKAKGKARAATKTARAAAAAAEAAAWAAAAEAARAAPPPPRPPPPPPRPFPRRSAPASGTETTTTRSSTVVAYGLLAAAALFLAGIVFFLAKTLFSLAAAAGLPSFLPPPARALLTRPFRLPWLAFRALVWRPRWWVAALEVLLMGAFFSRSVAAAIFLTHPVAWVLTPGAPGLAGSLATFLVAFVVLERGGAKAAAAARDAALAGGDGPAVAAAGNEARAATLNKVCSVLTATPIAWGLAAAAIRFAFSRTFSHPALLSVAAVAAIVWGWWRVVSTSASSSQWPGDDGSNERQRQQQQQFPMRRRRTDHLPGKAPRGATGDVKRVLSSRDFVEVLGLNGGGSGNNANGSNSGNSGGQQQQQLPLAASLRSLDDAAVKAAWRRLVKSVHPDRHTGSGSGATGAGEAFSLVTEAFESLRDAGARARYARSLGLVLS